MTTHNPSCQNQTRFTALDIFRGMTICLMIIVNTPGNDATTWTLLRHAGWNGFTLADLVFPSFLFAVGNALSFSSLRWKNMTSSQVTTKIIKRTVLIFGIGILLHSFPFCSFDSNSHLVITPLSHVRIMGVLQRIAICYCITSLLIHFTNRYLVLLSGIGSLVIYWLLLTWLGKPGYEFTETGNAVLRLDTLLLGTGHLYSENGFIFDPEGILSTLPSLFNVIAGYMTGILLQDQKLKRKLQILLPCAGFLLILAALIWNPAFPINKKLWSSTFALLTVGLDCLLLSCIILFTNLFSNKIDFSFFRTFGKNPLVIYVVSELGVSLLWLIPVGDNALYSFIYSSIFSHAEPIAGSFCFAVSWMLICWLVAYWLDKKQIRIKL